MPAIARIAELHEEFKSIRHYFHQYPELSGQEVKTAEKIAQYLESWGIEVHRHFGGTGLVGVLKNGDGSKSVALRAESRYHLHHTTTLLLLVFCLQKIPNVLFLVVGVLILQ